jgi:hypothetical protein
MYAVAFSVAKREVKKSKGKIETSHNKNSFDRGRKLIGKKTEGLS